MTPAFRKNALGRPCVGLCCFVKSGLSCSVSQLDSNSPYFQTILVQFKDIQILLFNVYIPPAKLAPSDIWLDLDNTISLAFNLYPDAFMIISGDFNSRIGPSNSTLAQQMNWHSDDLIPPWFQTPRSSKDSVINSFAPYLINLCISSNVFILNGSKGRDIPGEFTHLSPRGASVIDYALVSPALLPLLSDFCVCPRSESDHLPVALTLNIPFDPLVSPLPPPNPSRPYRWTPVAEQALSQWTQAPETNSQVCLILTSRATTDVIDAFNVIISSLVEHLRMASPSYPPSLTKNTWFDEECWKLKKQVRTLFHLFRNNPSSYNLHYYFQLRTTCRKYFQEKQHLFALRKWSTLHHAIISKNHKNFWDAVTRASHPTPVIYSDISEATWTDYFSKTFYSSSLPISNIDPQNIPEWPPVSPPEIYKLITSLKPAKAPGPDFIINEILLTNPDWWAAPLASLFTMINSSGLFPDIWRRSLLLPIFKKGNPAFPSNYRPISLLSCIEKLYAKFLLQKLSSWARSKNLPGVEQSGFRPGVSTLDHAFTLSFLAQKYSIHHKTNLFAAFIDLQGAFDSINRALLWKKLLNWGIGQRLLFLLQQLHSHNNCQIRLPFTNTLSSSFPINKGVRQGCILAPLLFNLFLADLPSSLTPTPHSFPVINNKPTPILLYADDTVLLALTKSGLRELISKFQVYCHSNDLVINANKTKIMVFSRSWSPSIWSINSQSYTQVKSFKYLGIHFHYNLTWTQHKKSVISSTSTHLLAITNFYFNSGNQYIPAAIQIFKAKIISHLLYGIPIWIQAVSKDLDHLASSFFRKILGIPNLIRLPTILLELGLHLPSTYAWLFTFKFWLKIHLFPSPDSLISVLMSDSYIFTWFKTVETKLHSINLSVELLADLNLFQAYRIIKDHLFLAEFNILKNSLNPTCSPLSLGLFPQFVATSNYFYHLTNPRLKRAFMLARLNIFPSAVHYGRFMRVPREKRLCLFCGESPDTLLHILLSCPSHDSSRRMYLEPWITNFPPQVSPLPQLLEDSIAPLTYSVASFLAHILLKTPDISSIKSSP